MQAQYVSDLATVIDDLRPAVPAVIPRRKSALWRAGFNYHLAVYGMTNGLLVGTWALTGHGFFWPFFPIMGWGIGLGVHGMVAANLSRSSRHRRSRNARDPGEWPLPREARRSRHRPVEGLSPVGSTALDPAPGRAEGLSPVGSTALDPAPGRAEGLSPAGSTALDPAPGRAEGLSPAGSTALDPAPDGAEGKATVTYVAVLFADVAESTRLNEVLGDAEWNRLRVRHLQMMRECLDGNGGSEVSTQGDGLFARFDAPLAAVACAVDMQRKGVALEGDEGVALALRVGVHAGEAIEEDRDLIGNMVNLASRVTDAAEPGQILVTEPVADQIGETFPVDDCGLKFLKGLARRRHLLAVRW